jgi:hypothetical protein
MTQNPRPSVFYKFRPYDADPKSKERGWVRESLFDHRIRFAKVPELNDPFEGRPLLVPQHKDPAAQAAAIYAAVLDDAHREGLIGEVAEKQAKFETAVMLTPQIPQQAYQTAFVETIHENFWVFSVCTTREPLLMWSHYADGHKGIALHFDSGVAPFDRVFEVQYSERYPEYPFPAFGSIASDEAAQAMLYTKSARWDYEEEHRVIRVVAEGTEQQRVSREMGLQWDGQFATLSESAIVGVTLGTAMPGELARELTAEIADRRPALEVWRAVTGANTYTLAFERVR